jgi:hypothetical protein
VPVVANALSLLALAIAGTGAVFLAALWALGDPLASTAFEPCLAVAKKLLGVALTVAGTHDTVSLGA